MTERVFKRFCQKHKYHYDWDTCEFCEEREIEKMKQELPLLRAIAEATEKLQSRITYIKDNKGNTGIDVIEAIKAWREIQR